MFLDIARRVTTNCDNITSFELPTNSKSVPLFSETPETNRFPKFEEAFLKQKVFLLPVIFGNVFE